MNGWIPSIPDTPQKEGFRSRVHRRSIVKLMVSQSGALHFFKVRFFSEWSEILSDNSPLVCFQKSGNRKCSFVFTFLTVWREIEVVIYNCNLNTICFPGFFKNIVKPEGDSNSWKNPGNCVCCLTPLTFPDFSKIEHYLLGDSSLGRCESLKGSFSASGFSSSVPSEDSLSLSSSLTPVTDL